MLIKSSPSYLLNLFSHLFTFKMYEFAHFPRLIKPDLETETRNL